MSDVIRIKRRATGGAAGAPASLANAELAYNEVDHTLYIGEGTGGAGGSATVIKPIGGDGHLASAALTGTPTAPTPTPAGDSSTKIATTAFVQGAIAAVSSGVTNISVTDGLSGGGTGAVTIGITLNGIVNSRLAQVPAHSYMGNNTGTAASPIYVTAAQLMTDLGAAPLASPAFTGTPTAPTAGNGTSTTQLATCAYVLAVRLDQFQPPTSDVPWNSRRITSLLDPSNPQDAATKAYVDNLSQGLDAKASVRSMTNANVTLSGVQSIDAVTNIAGDRILLIGQTTASQNGVYIMAAGAWTRAADLDTWNELIAAYVWVEEGNSFKDTGWLCTVDAGGTLGTTNVTWVQFSGAGQITAGAGLTKIGNTIDAVGTAGRISVAADSIDIDVAYVGQTSITTLGTIATGTWNATTIAVNKGGTGATSLTGYVKGAGTAALTASATIPSTDITGLGTMAAQNANNVNISGGVINNIEIDGGVF